MLHVQVLFLIGIIIVSNNQDNAHTNICTSHHNNHVVNNILQLHMGRHLWKSGN